jgi:hypothetical protein
MQRFLLLARKIKELALQRHQVSDRVLAVSPLGDESQLIWVARERGESFLWW